MVSAGVRVQTLTHLDRHHLWVRVPVHHREQRALEECRLLCRALGAVGRALVEADEIEKDTARAWPFLEVHLEELCEQAEVDALGIRIVWLLPGTGRGAGETQNAKAERLVRRG